MYSRVHIKGGGGISGELEILSEINNPDSDVDDDDDYDGNDDDEVDDYNGDDDDWSGKNFK